jgi:hypothetical protein
MRLSGFRKRSAGGISKDGCEGSGRREASGADERPVEEWPLACTEHTLRAYFFLAACAGSDTMTDSAVLSLPETV